MAELIQKTYLDFAGLQAYDALLKDWVVAKDNEIDLKSLKSVAKVGNDLYFFNTTSVPMTDDETPAVNTALAKATVSLNSDAVQALVEKIGMDTALKTDATTLSGAVNELDAAIDNLADIATTGAAADASLDTFEITPADDEAGTPAVNADYKNVQAAVESLAKKDAAQDATIAEIKSTVDSITGTDGILGQAKEYTDAEIEKVNTAIETVADEAVVSVEKLTTATEGFAASYVVKQNNVQVGETIDIPKDFLVKSAEVKVAEADDVSGLAEGTTYIDFVVNTKEGDGQATHIYLNVETLVKDFTVAKDATQVQLAVSDTREISATLVDGGVDAAALADSAVETDKIADGAITTDKLAQDVLDAIDAASEANDAIAALDATVSTKSDTEPDPTLDITVVQTDGKLTSITAAVREDTFDSFGSAEAAYDKIIAIPTDEISSLFGTTEEGA